MAGGQAGAELELARTIRRALEASKTPLDIVSASPASPFDLDTAAMSTALGKAAISGDFIMLGTEVNSVIRALRHNGIGVAALHSHMIDETPRLYFMHFWANADAVTLANGLRAALDKTNSKKR